MCPSCVLGLTEVCPNCVPGLYRLSPRCVPALSPLCLRSVPALSRLYPGSIPALSPPCPGCVPAAGESSGRQGARCAGGPGAGGSGSGIAPGSFSGRAARRRQRVRHREFPSATIGVIRGHLRAAEPPRGSGGEQEGARVAGGRPGAAGWGELGLRGELGLLPSVLA